MASANAVTRPTPAQIARATAAAIPGEVSTRPLLGILGVVLGAGSNGARDEHMVVLLNQGFGQMGVPTAFATWASCSRAAGR